MPRARVWLQLAPRRPPRRGSPLQTVPRGRLHDRVARGVCRAVGHLLPAVEGAAWAPRVRVWGNKAGNAHLGGGWAAWQHASVTATPLPSACHPSIAHTRRVHSRGLCRNRGGYREVQDATEHPTHHDRDGRNGRGAQGNEAGCERIGAQGGYVTQRVRMTSGRRAVGQCGWGDPHRLVVMRQGSVPRCSDKADRVVSHQQHL